MDLGCMFIVLREIKKKEKKINFKKNLTTT